MSKSALDLLKELVGSTEVQKRRTRETRLLKDPDEETPAGWRLCVPKCFNSALDISQTIRKERGSGRDVLTWTQGSAFSFKVGDVLYDTPKAYGPWPAALKHLGFAAQVIDSADAVPQQRGQPRDPGRIRATILRPSASATRLCVTGSVLMTQDEFVEALITGQFSPAEGERS